MNDTRMRGGGPRRRGLKPSAPAVSRALRRDLAAAFSLLVACVLPAAPSYAFASSPEDEVKAVFLFKFAPFVDWPASAFSSPVSPFRLCILGEDPFGATLDQAVSGQQFETHPIEVRRLQSPDGASGCHILYFRGPRSAALAEAFSRLKGSPVLTVTEDDGPVSGGVIRFVVRGGRVRFAIDPNAAAANGVRISSKLLALAIPAKPGS